ncbi:MAG: ABC transporter permease [Euryarchaeota archaeon]|nr:ABC transporter permease [Euryarchaeota archaeon]
MRMSLLHLALQNLRMRKFRTLGVVLAIAIASAALFSSIMLMKSMSSSIELGMAQLGADIMVVPGDAEPEGAILLGGAPEWGYFSLRYAEAISSLEDVAGVAPLAFVETTEGCCFRSGVYIVGFDREKDFLIKPWVEKQVGELRAFDAVAGAGYDWLPGSEVRLYGVSFTIVAKIPATGVASFDRGVFIPLDRLYWLSKRSREAGIAGMPLEQGEVSALMVRLEPDANPVSVARAIEFQFPELRAVVAKKALSNVKRQMQVMLQSLLALSALTWLTAVILVSVILSMSVNERRREFGILRALGATKRFIFGQVVVEAYLLATLGSVLGMLAGYTFLALFQDVIEGYLRMPYLLPNELYVALISIATIDVALILATIASVYPAYRSAELEPYDAIRSGE